jgi:signal transduction histidine kinase
MTPLLELILDRVKPMLNCDGAGVSLREADGIRQLAVRRPTGIPMTDAERAPISVPQVEDAIWQHALKGAPLVVEDVLGDTAEAKTFRDVWGGTTKGTPAEYVRGFMTIPLIAKGQTIGVLNFASSQPGYFNQSHVDLVMAVAGPAAAAIENARLFEQTQARTKELSALLEVSRAVVSTLDTRELMGVILDQLHGILEHSGSAILVRDGEDLVIVDARSQAGAEREIGMRIPTAASGVLWRTMAERRPLIIDDIRADEPLANNYREVIGGLGLLEFEPFSSIRAWMAVPLTVSDDVIGMLTMSRTEPGYFKPEQSQLVALFANQAALAIENARLFEESQRSGRETEALFRSDEQIFRSLDLDDVLQALADVAVDLLGAEKTLVTTWDAKERRLVPRASRNWSAQIIEFMQSPEARMTPGGRPEKMVVAEDSAADVAGPWRDVLAAEGIDHWADIPLISPENKILGTFAAAYGPDHKLTEADKRMLLALAERAVIAIGNADLHAQARQVTAMEERQRLARELHDSVSQALYGIALGARTARTILDRDPKKAVEPVDYVLSLAEAGLAEMRALIFELRPESLESEGLVAALEKQLAAMKARYGLETIAELGEEPVLSIEQKEVAYRIAQEAMHNVVKHARASSVRVSLSLDGDAVTLTVADDGAGFDPDGDFPGHLGLRSMRERADRAAATLSIESAPGAGTTLTLTMPVSPA